MGLYSITGQTISAVGLFYLIVAGNFIGDTFSCDLQRLLTHSTLAKHGVLLVGSLIWVCEGSGDADTSTFLQLIAKALAIYVLFVLSTKSKRWTLLPLLAVMIVDQLLRIWEKTSEATHPAAKRVMLFRKCLHALCITIIVAGTLFYAHRQIRDKSTEFSWARFILGTNTCRGL